VVSKLNN
jgi:hypothetical protein